MMTEQQLTQWMDTYGTGIFRLCYLCPKDYHLAQDAAVVDTMGYTTKNQVHNVYLVFWCSKAIQIRTISLGCNF